MSGETFDWITWCQDVTGVYVTTEESGESMELVRDLTAPTADATRGDEDLG